MSIELLPQEHPQYPNTYHVRPNRCRCHPETCCCNNWAVHKPDGEKHLTHFNRVTADAVAEALNASADAKRLHEENQKFRTALERIERDCTARKAVLIARGALGMAPNV